jgi:hypothetical protein
MKLLQLFKSDVLDFDLAPTELSDIQPMTELDQFASATAKIINGLDDQIESLDNEINMKIARLGDLRRIRESQSLALRYMNGDI